MENEHLKVERECLVGRTITAVDFKNYGSAQDDYIRLTLDHGGYWEQRMTFTPAEHRLAIAEKALKELWSEPCDPTSSYIASQALKEMEEIV